MSINFSEKEFQEALNNARSIHPITPLVPSKRLTEKYWVEILLKLENTDPIGSYKWRGAWQNISSLDEWTTVVTASAGNHAQWVALACKSKGVLGTIFMPKTTPLIKVRKTRDIWGDAVRVVLEWDNFDAAFWAAKEEQNANNSVFVHPFDDKQTILWQSTVWLEILDQAQQLRKNPTLIMVPNGGWWLTSGIQLAVNHKKSDTRVIAVEPQSAASMSASLKAGKVEKVTPESTIADGAKVGCVWELCFEICQENDIEVITSPEWRLCSTVLEMHSDWRTLEWAWALWVDGLKSLNETVFEELRSKNASIVVILSGGNIDTDAYGVIKEASLKYEWLKRDYLIEFPERPWALEQFLSLLPDEIDITNLQYDKNRSRSKNPVGVSLEVLGPSIFEWLDEKLTAQWYIIKSK